jgi:hypothetical protein
MNNMQGYMAQDGHALLHERIEAPLRERIKELEQALQTLLANDWKFAGTFDGLEWNLSEEQMKLIQAALKKVSSPEELRNEVTKKEKP